MADRTNEEEMLAEYDFTDGVRGKHLEEYRRSPDPVVIAESTPNKQSEPDPSEPGT